MKVVIYILRPLTNQSELQTQNILKCTNTFRKTKSFVCQNGFEVKHARGILNSWNIGGVARHSLSSSYQRILSLHCFTRVMLVYETWIMHVRKSTNGNFNTDLKIDCRIQATGWDGENLVEVSVVIWQVLNYLLILSLINYYPIIYTFSWVFFFNSTDGIRNTLANITLLILYFDKV